MTDIVSALQGVQFAYNTVKAALDIFDELKDADKDLKILETRQSLIEFKKKLQMLEEECLKQADENRELKNQLRIQKNTFIKNGVFWGTDGTGPYCPSCIQKEPRREVLITENHPGEPESWLCPVCTKVTITPAAQKRLSDQSMRSMSEALRRF